MPKKPFHSHANDLKGIAGQVAIMLMFNGLGCCGSVQVFGRACGHLELFNGTVFRFRNLFFDRFVFCLWLLRRDSGERTNLQRATASGHRVA